MKEQKEEFRFWILSEEAKVGNSRNLTNEETKYIRRSNWVRLMSLLGYLFILVFGVGMVFTWVLIISSIPDLDAYSSTVVILARVAPALIVTSLLVYLLRKRIPWEVPLWPSVKNLRAFELTGALVTDVREHSIIGEDLSFSVNTTRVKFPEHWEPYLPKIFPDKLKLTTVSLWAIKRNDTTDKRYSYMSRLNSSRVLSRFHDYVYYPVSCGPLTIEEDAKNSLPYFRANFFWIGLAIFFLLIGAFLSIFLSIELNNNNNLIARLEHKISDRERELQIGQDIDPTIFTSRGIAVSQADKNYKKQILYIEKPFEYFDVTMSNSSRPFLLTPQEYKIVMRLSSVTPNVILGDNKASSETLSVYRNNIANVIHKSSDIELNMRNNALAILSSIDDETLEKQLRNYGQGFRVNPEYAMQFLPTPVLYLPSNSRNTLRICANQLLFCTAKYNKLTAGKADVLIINDNNAGNGLSTNFQIAYMNALDSLNEYKQRRNTMYYIKPIKYWTQSAGAIGVLLFILSFTFIVSYLQAKVRISRFYKRMLTSLNKC